MHNLIVQTAFIGDLLLSIPLIRNTKNLFPEDRLVLVCRKGFGAFFKDSGLVDDVIEIEKSNRGSYLAALTALGKFSIRHVIVPHQSFRSANFVRHVRASGSKVGFRLWWNTLFFDKRVVRPMQYPDAIRQMSLLAALDSKFSETFSQDLAVVGENPRELDTLVLREKIPSWASMRVEMSSDAIVGEKIKPAEQDKANWVRAKQVRADEGVSEARRLNDHGADGVLDASARRLNENKLGTDAFDRGVNEGIGGTNAFDQSVNEGTNQKFQSEKQKRKVALVAPGSVWPTKHWHRQGFIDVLKKLDTEGYLIQLIGTKDEIEVCQYISRHVPGAYNLAGRTTIAETIQLMSNATLLICNDSGAMHMAAAAGLPTVSIFGPTTLALGYRPWNDNAVVVQKSMSCRPCSAHGTKHCPLKTHACMQQISAGDVLGAIRELGV